MKNILLLISLFLALQSQAQTDTANSPITVLLPVKAIVIYGFYMSQNPNWSDRKTPDAIVSLIGSGNQPDSLVTVTLPAGKLATFASQLIQDRYGALSALNRSIFNNIPAITGYTSLPSQINAKASGSSSQKDAAIYVMNRYNDWVQSMSELYNGMYSAGLNWIRN